MHVRYESRSDTELIRASRSDPAAFEVLFERHAAPMRGWLAAQVGDTAAANDLLAETFAQAWRSRKRFVGDDPASGAAWLYGIARNLLRQVYKRGRVETAARRRLGMPEHAPHDDQLEEVLGRLDAQAFAPELDRALATLPVAQRCAVEERVVKERSYEEIAEALACSSENARARVSRGLRTLNGLLKGVQP
jgi:RNA polymerase sigma-70 factor (ECF subfamily)